MHINQIEEQGLKALFFSMIVIVEKQQIRYK